MSSHSRRIIETTATHLVPEEAAANVDLLATDDDDLLARESLLGNYGGQPTEQVSLPVDDDGSRGERRGHFEGWWLGYRKYTGNNREQWTQRLGELDLRLEEYT